MQKSVPFAAFIGLDWADKKHALELLLCHPEKLTRLEPESVPMRSLRRLVKAAVPSSKIARLCPTLPDHELFRALPGAARQKYAGVAPVTERSGNKSWVHWRYSCPTFLRQTFIEWVGQTVPRSFWAQAFYKSCRARGVRHQAALRALAFKWIRIPYRCWVTRQPYDEARYLMALQKRHAPLLKFAAEASA
jgi:hypothetical protein